VPEPAEVAMLAAGLPLLLLALRRPRYPQVTVGELCRRLPG
jgi:hypothetical protein